MEKLICECAVPLVVPDAAVVGDAVDCDKCGGSASLADDRGFLAWVRSMKTLEGRRLHDARYRT